MSNTWNDEHDACGAKWSAEGMSRRDIATALNAKFGTNYTRDAVIGRAWRNGWKAENAPTWKRRTPSKISPQCLAAAARKNRKPKSIHQRVLSMPQFNRDGLTGLRCVEVDPQIVDILDLAPNGCRWPYGDRPFTFCNHPKLEGLPYCLDHYALSVGRGTGEERRADKGWT